MNMNVEPTDIVEFYPQQFYTVDEADSEATEHSKVVIRGKEFTRNIYRPRHGPDVLLQQSVASHDTYFHLVDLTSIPLRSEERFRELITESEPPAHLRSQPPGLNHLWSWHNIAKAVASYALFQYAEAGYYFNTISDSQIVTVRGEEAWGRLYISSEVQGWEPGLNIHDTDIEDLGICDLCHQKYSLFDDDTSSIRDLVRFCCPHVFHRRCLLPFLWSKRKRDEYYFRCPSCNDDM